MEMDMKLIESPEEGLTPLSRQTLKYLHWTVRKIITTIETNPHGLVWYELQPRGENRSSEDPTPAIEANLMFKLERSMWFFDFEPSPLKPGDFIITDRDSNLSEILINDLKNDPDPERKYKRGWLVNYNLDKLKEYLKAIDIRLNGAIDVQLEEKSRLSNSDADLTIGNRLLSIFPSGKKYKAVKKMAEILSTGVAISNFNLARCIKSSLTKRKYKLSSSSYDQIVQHRLRTLKKYWKKIGYTVKSVHTPMDGYQRHSL